MGDPAGRTIRLHPDLPIFRLDDGDRVLLYTPGRPLLTTADVALGVAAVLAGASHSDAHVNAIAETLEHRGRDAWAGWHQFATTAFEPECLTLYLSNQCNLACGYCYAVPPDEVRARMRTRVHAAPAEFPLLSESVVVAAARLVAGHCAAKGKPLTVVFHGGGEPTVHWDLLTRIWDHVACMSRAHGIRLWSYVATHGAVTEDRARWLGAHFDLVGLSCDGPPEIQHANRPFATGSTTAKMVERTARILSDEAASVVVRSTITPASVRRQSEIVHYVCGRLYARAIRFEPAYDGRGGPGRFFMPDDAEDFVAHYLEAQRAAEKWGADLQLSGVRIDELHGPYCNPSRGVLQLTPDGTASACFLSVGNQDPSDRILTVGELNSVTGEFLVDPVRMAAQRRQAAAIPGRCLGCHNVYHCARDCPDVCLLTDSEIPEERPEGFRCRVQKLVGRHHIWQRALTQLEGVK